jgi:dephospho-CoA kinase
VAAAHQIPIVGLTGAIAAGKSTALEALARLGAATLSADAVVHDLLGTERVRDVLVGRWGGEVAPDGVLDRAKVGEIVFAHPEELDWLEATLHPLVAERIVGWRRGLEEATEVAVVEVPLLFETGMDEAFDTTIAVVAPDAVRVERAGARGTADLEARAGRQLSQNEKAARATHVVSNDGDVAALERELRRIWPELVAPGGAEP